jgi:hypothetical protein
MDSIDYNESVTLLFPAEAGRTLPLSEAVREIVHTSDKGRRLAAYIVRDEKPPFSSYTEILAIYVQPDFPAKAQTNEAQQSQRFIDTAREIGADESGEAFERAFGKIVPQRCR